MKRWKLVLIVAIFAVVGIGAWSMYVDGKDKGPSYRFVTVEKGDVESVVTATGTLNPVTTVSVGTQVSGIISNINVDFNDKVHKGEVIARLDTTLLAIAVRDAKAQLAGSQANYDNSQREYERTKGLYSTGMASEADYDNVLYQRDASAASLESAKVGLLRAQENLSYATIYAPISGTVIERDVQVGQTVASSFSAPQLFLIANDLSKMQILASVDESDIGQIRQGQEVDFTVQAYPDTTFKGVVAQVRMQSAMVENVVDYTVVVNVDNPTGKLLPGMTATCNFLIQRANDVLKVSNAALRFRPTEAMIAEFRAERAADHPQGAAADSVQARWHRRRQNASANSGGYARMGNGQRQNAGGYGGGQPGQGRSDMHLLWYVDGTGKLRATRVQVGLTDGQYTAVDGRNLTAGMNVIAGVTDNGSTSGSSNPFQPQQGGGFRRMIPGM